MSQLSPCPAKIEINEVAPRDGLQIEARFVPTEGKIRWIDALSTTGLRRIEATSFTSPKAIPNLHDAADVVTSIQRREGVDITVLVPNVKGTERALACQVDEINLVMSASNSHGLANLRMTPKQSLEQFEAILEVSKDSSVFINASLSTAFGCPFEGDIPEARVLELVEKLIDLGIQASRSAIPPAWPTLRRSNACVKQCLSAGQKRRSRCTSTTPAAWGWPTPWRRGKQVLADLMPH